MISGAVFLRFLLCKTEVNQLVTMDHTPDQTSIEANPDIFPNEDQLQGQPPNGSLPVSRLGSFLFRQMLVGVNDGRFFLGSFYCLDKQGNILLQDAVEYRSTRNSKPCPMEQHGLGLILIPSSCRVSCHVDCSIEEQISLLSLER